MERLPMEILESFYEVFPWPEDPRSLEGRHYVELTREFMGKLLQHPWIDAWRKRGAVRILEICSGAGFGGITLAQLLNERGVKTELLLTDLRPSVLRKAEEWGGTVLREKFRTLAIDARNVHELGEKFDLILLYGLSTPHFDPWELIQILASVTAVLDDDGVFVVDETDRRYRIFVQLGYKWALAEGGEDKPTVSFHTGYNLYRGTCQRVYAKLTSGPQPVTMELFMWGLAEVAALMWVFFGEVDLLPLRDVRHFLLATHPRKAISPDDLKLPTFLKST